MYIYSQFLIKFLSHFYLRFNSESQISQPYDVKMNN